MKYSGPRHKQDSFSVARWKYASSNVKYRERKKKILYKLSNKQTNEQTHRHVYLLLRDIYKLCNCV